LRSDDQLVALFRAGNDDAFGTIHDRYRTRLLAYIRQMLGGSKSDAEDALQDVFLRAYGALRANGKEIALRAWLYRVAHNRCIDQLRRPVPQAADIFDVSRTPTDDPASATERREDLRRLVQDVRRLPEQQRSVLLMREMEGLSYADLAAALDISVPAVKSLLVRARMGLVQASEARDTACFEVREDLAAAHGRGVRSNGRARRHLRDCAGCRTYKAELRGRQRALAGLSPIAGVGPLSVLAKLIGGGGAASGAAGGTAVAGGGAMVGGSAAAVSATKLALVVGAAVVTAGGAVEMRSQLDKPVHTKATHAQVTAASPRAARALTAPGRSPSLVAAAAARGADPAASARPGADGRRQDKPVADPLAGRPDVLAPAPADPVPAIPSTAAAPVPPASTTTTTGPAGRDVQSAVETVAKVLPVGTATSQSSTQGSSSSTQSQSSASSSSGTSSTNGSQGSASGSSSSGGSTGSGSGATASGASAGSSAGSASG
jgi:RNA polymerase sigma factor (sigma-70 family)